jgi:hypothetical protein
MIGAATWTPALAVARAQNAQDRYDTAKTQMTQIIADYFTNSYSCWANRWADGLTAIDNAANALSVGWAAPPASDALVTNVLNACAAWLHDRRFPLVGWRVTGWREDSIVKLYWQVTWKYAAAVYAQDVAAQIAINNVAAPPVPTLVTQVPAVASLVGNFFEFPIVGASGYTHQGMGAGRMIRGDTRGPAAIALANGFQPINWGTAAYEPFFYGHATGDTPSVTTDAVVGNVRLAINAIFGARFHATAGPAWLAAELGRLGAGPPRGYIYEMNAGALASARVTGRPQGEEHVFLAIPDNAITNWWAVVRAPTNRHTVGPFPYPPPLNAPGVAIPGAAGPAPVIAPGVAATLSGGVDQLA